MSLNTNVLGTTVLNTLGDDTTNVNISIPVRNFVIDTVNISVPIRNQVVDAVVDISIPVQNFVFATVNISIPVRNQVVDAVVDISIPVQNEVITTVNISIPVRNQVVDALVDISIPVQNEVIDTTFVNVTIPIQNISVDTIVNITVPVRNVVVNTIVGIAIDIQNRVTTPVNISISLQNVVIEKPVNLSIAIQNKVTEQVNITLPIRNNVISPSVGNTLYWSASVLIGGVDFSSCLVNDIVIEKEEDAATIADFDIVSLSGTINIYDWIDQSVIIDYTELDSLGNVLGVYRKFTGKVNRPKYNPTTGITSFNCTDNLKLIIEATPRTVIDDTLVGSQWSSQIFVDQDDNWQYHNQRLRTINKSYNLNSQGLGVLADWNNTTVDFTFTEDDVLYQTIDIDLIDSNDLVNTINIDIEHRYGLRWQRLLGGMWVYPTNFIEYLQEPDTLPTEELIIDAINTEGWALDSANFFGLPPSGTYTIQGALQSLWTLRPEDTNLVTSFTFQAKKRWLQSATSKYNLTVKSPASITNHGVVEVQDSYSMTGDFSDDWEDLEADLTQNSPTSPGAGFLVDAKFAEGETVVDINQAIETALAIAKTDILSSHRSNELQLIAILQPILELEHFIEVNTTYLQGSGKIRRIIDTLGVTTGNAQTKITVAVYQPEQTGQIEDALTAPSNPLNISTIPSSVAGLSVLESNFGNVENNPVDSDSFRGYVGNKILSVLNFGGTITPPVVSVTNQANEYDERFVIEYPEVESSVRDSIEYPSTASFDIAIPENNLVILGIF